MIKFNPMRPIIFLTLGVLMSGCGIYRSGFQCPPGKGIGCASTSEVLEMIVEEESDSGKNLFIPNSRSCK